MRIIDQKDFDTLFQVLKQESSKLDSLGHIPGELVWGDGERTPHESLIERLAMKMRSILKGGKIVIATVVPRSDNGNYYFDGQQLWLVSTKTKSGNLLVEIIRTEHSGNTGNFPYYDETNLIKTYMIKLV